MHPKKTLLLAALLVLASTASGQLLKDILPLAPPETSGVEPSAPPPASSAPAPSPSAPPPVTEQPQPSSERPAPTSAVVPPEPGKPKPSQSNPRPGSGSITGTGTTTATVTGTPPAEKESDKSTGGLATAGIVVGSIVVAAAIGIWVFRKWKLSPSRDFQSKIRGDDYTDYPRSYESDTVFLRNIGDQPAEPVPSKSPYAANAAVAPVEEHYYDPTYANDQTGYGANDGYGHNGYAHGAAAGAAGYDVYDQHGGYDNGYNQGQGQGHSDYSGSQVGGGYAQSQVGGYSQAGYAPSSVGGGGYQQHGYDDYGRR